MNDSPIGIIDSGVGGLSIWREIVRQLPNESTIYLADSANCPYGGKKEEEIYALAKGLITFLIERKVKLIVVACNTITVSCIDKLRVDFPDIPIVGIVPVVKTAGEVSKTKVIGVLSTETTSESKYHKKLIKNFANGCQVINIGTNQFVPFVERGEIEGDKVEKVVRDVTKKFVDNNVDTIALGCSHFPFLEKTISKIVGDKVKILESSGAISRQVNRILTNNNILSSLANPSHVFYTTGDPKEFMKVYSKLLGEKISDTVKMTNKAIINNNSWKNKKVAVLGFGIEGEAVAKWIKKKNAIVTILDKKDKKEFDGELIGDLEKIGVSFIFGKDYLSNLDFDIIVRSPGVKLNAKELDEAKQKGIKITSQTKIFFEECPCQIIGITGTKGKGTTSTLIHEMLKAQGKDVYLGGNIGQPPIDFLDKLNKQSLVVLELSSFQLQDLNKSPHVAVVLMITSEHLDYHKDLYEYIDAKRNILRFQKKDDIAIINRDYPATHESDIHTSGKVYRVSREKETDDGCYVENMGVFTKINGNLEEIIDVNKILIPGKHNLENVCAAVMAASIFNVSKQNIIKVLTTFKGLEHRLESVREVGGVKYYDDSFSTTPETAIAAIEAFKDPEILILGGSSKNSDFKNLGEVISNAGNIKAIIGIGVEWKKIRSQIPYLKSETLVIEGAKDMKTIVSAASKIAKDGDVVLLSPACASFDMFKNYKDRGEQFKKEVQAL